MESGGVRDAFDHVPCIPNYDNPLFGDHIDTLTRCRNVNAIARVSDTVRDFARPSPAQRISGYCSPLPAFVFLVIILVFS